MTIPQTPEQTILLSKCCNTPIKATHGCDDDLEHLGKPCTCEIVSSWYECTKCLKPTDPAGDETTPSPTWEEELRKMFPVGYTIPKSMLGESGDHGLSTSFEEVKTFIQNQIDKAREEARAEVGKKLLSYRVLHNHNEMPCYTDGYLHGCGKCTMNVLMESLNKEL